MPANDLGVTAYLGLGGNIGDPVASMSEALQRLDEQPDCSVRVVSRLYRTPPWGNTEQAWFFNAAAAIDTTRSPHDLLDLCLDIERAMKRIRMERWGPRTLDMDILAYGDVQIHDDRLTLPHPRMKDRAFVLMPLADLAPALKLEGRAITTWLAEADQAGIELASESREWWRTAIK